METGESVYNLIPKPQETTARAPIYRSQFKSQVPPSCSTFGLHNTTKLVANNAGTEVIGWDEQNHGSCHVPRKRFATFGKEVLHTVDPRSFLTKGAGLPPAAPLTSADAGGEPYRRSLVVPRKPAVVRRLEKPVMGLVTEKNFVVSNAVDIITAPARRPKELPPLHSQNPGFGTVPQYLHRIKRDVDQKKLAASVQQGEGAAAAVEQRRLLSEEERLDMQHDLRRKWDEAHRQYQSLTFNIDTVSKVERKERLEVEMEMMEKAMQKLNKKQVYLRDDGSLI